MNTCKPDARDKIKGTLMYIDIKYHCSKIFHVEVIERTEEKGKKTKTRQVNTFLCISVTLISLKMILLLVMRLGSITKLLKLRDSLCNCFQHGSLGLKNADKVLSTVFWDKIRILFNECLQK
jgi:hypothetical protein